MQISVDQKKSLLPFNLRYLSELCCVDGPLGAGQATFPVVSDILSANCNMSSIMAVFSLSDWMSAQCHVPLLRVLNCCPTCTMKHRITAATKTTRSCCRCWRAAVSLIHGQSHYAPHADSCLQNKETYNQRMWFYFIDIQYLLYWSLFRPLSGLSLTVLTVLHLGLYLTGCIAACFETFPGNSWSRSMRSISVSEVRWHAHTLVLSHKHIGFGQQDLKMKSLPDRQEKNRFYYGLYCLVGFVLVSITDVMKLLDDNQGETESAATAVGTRAISAQ